MCKILNMYLHTQSKYFQVGRNFTGNFFFHELVCYSSSISRLDGGERGFLVVPPTRAFLFLNLIRFE